MYFENDMVSDIVTAGGEHAKYGELEEDTAHNVRTLSEQLASIRHLVRIRVSRNIDST